MLTFLIDFSLQVDLDFQQEPEYPSSRALLLLLSDLQIIII